MIFLLANLFYTDESGLFSRLTIKALDVMYEYQLEITYPAF